MPLAHRADTEYIKEFTSDPVKLWRYQRDLPLREPQDRGEPGERGSVLVIMLSYNRKDDTLQCLESIGRQTYANMGVLIIDNASCDGTPEAIRSTDSGAAIISLPQNRGWAGGNNLGVKIAIEIGFDFVLLLNNDTVLKDDTIAVLLQSALSLGPCLLHPAIYYYSPAEGAQLDPSIDPNGVAGWLNDPYLFELNFAYGACLLVD